MKYPKEREIISAQIRQFLDDTFNLFDVKHNDRYGGALYDTFLNEMMDLRFNKNWEYLPACKCRGHAENINPDDCICSPDNPTDLRCCQQNSKTKRIKLLDILKTK